MEYVLVSYTNKEIKKFKIKLNRLEKRAGKKLTIDELVDKAIENDDNDFLMYLNYVKKTIRIENVEKMLEGCDFNFKDGMEKMPVYTEEEVDGFENILEDYWKDGILDFYKTIELAIKDKRFDLVNYLFYIEERISDVETERKIHKSKMSKAFEYEEEYNNYVKKILKSLTNFSVVKERKEGNMFVIFFKQKPFQYYMGLNKINNKELDEIIATAENLEYDLFYLKNKNRHDKNLNSIGEVNRNMESVKTKR